MSDAEHRFVADLLTLCQEHGMAAVPSYELKPSAHDPMLIVPLDDFWRDFLANQIYSLDEDETP